MQAVTIRPITSADRGRLAAAFGRLSPNSRRMRFLSHKKVLTSPELDRLTQIDHVSHEALIALNGRDEIVAVARYAALPGRDAIGEIAFVVDDEWHGRGLGRILAEAVIDRARRNGFRLMRATTLAENGPSRGLLRRLGFSVCSRSGDVLTLRLDLEPTARAA